MKITIEYDNEQDAIQALRAGNWSHAIWQLDQEIRSIVKHGYIGHRKAHDLEIEAYNKCREMLREKMIDNDLTFDI